MRSYGYRHSFTTRLRLTGAWVLLAGLMLRARRRRPARAKTETSREPATGKTASAASASRGVRGAKPDKEEEEADDDVGFRWKGYPSLQLGKGTHVDFRARVQFDVRQ